MKVDRELCMRCGGCVGVCPVNCIELLDVLEIGNECINCGNCKKFCPVGALHD